jgi:hypothetical protein
MLKSIYLQSGILGAVAVLVIGCNSYPTQKPVLPRDFPSSELPPLTPPSLPSFEVMPDGTLKEIPPETSPELPQNSDTEAVPPDDNI